jgi:hypothetical protein
MWTTIRQRIVSYLPLANFVVAGTALCFQTNILYPWHNEISKDIQKANREITTIKKLLPKH